MVRGGPPVPDGGSAEGLVTLPLYRKELASLMLVFLGVSLAFRGLRPSIEAPASLIPVLLGSGFIRLKVLASLMLVTLVSDWPFEASFPL